MTCTLIFLKKYKNNKKLKYPVQITCDHTSPHTICHCRRWGALLTCIAKNDTLLTDPPQRTPTLQCNRTATFRQQSLTATSTMNRPASTVGMFLLGTYVHPSIRGLELLLLLLLQVLLHCTWVAKQFDTLVVNRDGSMMVTTRLFSHSCTDS